MKYTNQAKSGRKAMPALLRDRRSRIAAERSRRPAGGGGAPAAGRHPAAGGGGARRSDR
jgi:hypothetical protein